MSAPIHGLFTALGVVIGTMPALAGEYMVPLPPEEPLIEGLNQNVSIYLGDPERELPLSGSVPYINYVRNGIQETLYWPSIKEMIETDDYQGIPKEWVLEACKKLQATLGTWDKGYNVGEETLPPANYPCKTGFILG